MYIYIYIHVYAYIYIYIYIYRCEFSIATSVTLNSYYLFLNKCDLHMYCILFRVSVCFGFGIVYAGCLHDLPAKGHQIEQHTSDLWAAEAKHNLPQHHTDKSYTKQVTAYTFPYPASQGEPSETATSTSSLPMHALLGPPM